MVRWVMRRDLIPHSAETVCSAFPWNSQTDENLQRHHVQGEQGWRPLFEDQIDDRHEGNR